ncbi:MAG TPA: NAD(P)/FAD-dependent oxidoreductase [Leptospiraceae bacterium]|nr:NAD(P)/FAD-dependent oxidoreductase [Leptospiraceae bacterium]HMX30792.1 NAD(P)/FAD-dependent oxidoreductase [Leptospiraceae bacterium]HMY30134.1 NAD(P)/FAD-dependent oxidoreductase [Leptospiraceae bacterium]HMZ64359.1 NAD(P)/FAD-dependent oxidoreductase [Leptospiraceae bacterium]HNA06617.1 NAD(P)/FAD-dependent oxidoreductase [Leptospiraceae bacterium]
MEKENHFDAIVIGSGMGALTTASILARLKNKKVLVLEKHFKLGGFTHTFKREGKFLWDVGIHYVGDMGKQSMLRKLFDIVTEGKVDWNPMPDLFERFVYPEITFDQYSSEEKFRSDLIQKFPHEKQAIENYFSDVKSFSNWATKQFTLKAKPMLLDTESNNFKLTGAKSPMITTKEYLDANFKDPVLKAVLVSQWGDYGLPPSTSAFYMHAGLVVHYLNGGFYPVGGAGTIAESVKPIIEKKGGAMHIFSEVTEIIMDGEKAIGVKVKQTKGKNILEKEYFAPIIISDAGVYNTYTKLIPQNVEIPFRESISNFVTGASSVTLYLGFKENPAKLGFKGENYWIYNSIDHDKNFNEKDNLLKGEPTAFYASFPSLKDPKAESFTGEVISFVNYEPFAKWKNGEWKNRGTDYKELKDRIADGMLNFMERHFPGYKDLVEYKELSTPLTNEYFTDHKAGTIYGIPCTLERYTKEWMGVKTPIENVFITGADACSPGISGALMGGFAAATVVLGYNSMMGIMKDSAKI